MSKIAPTVKVELDKERNLFMDLNAMVAFEDKTGKSMLSMADLSSLTAKDIRAMLWACLIHEDETLTVEQVGKMIHTGNMNEINEKLNEAWGDAIPEAEEGGKDDRPLTKNRLHG